MVRDAISRNVLLAVLSGALYVGCHSAVEDKVGGETNWLVACSSDSNCTGSAKCLCGICTRSCAESASCGFVSGGVCVSEGSAAFDAACSTTQAIPGACFAPCPATGCKGNKTCMDGVCVPPPSREAGASDAGDAGTGNVKNPSDSGSCRSVALPTHVVTNCALLDCSDGSCRSCGRADIPSFTGSTSEACGDNPCNANCRRFADGATPLTNWPYVDGGGPAPVVQEYYYGGSLACPAGTQPQWDFLTYGADTPGDSYIDLRAKMLSPGAYVGDAGSYEHDLVTIGRRAGDAPEMCTFSNAAGSSCPVDVFGILGKDAYEPPFTLRVTLVPSGADHPILKWWEIRFSCIDPRFTRTCEYGGRNWANRLSTPAPGQKQTTVGCKSGCYNGEPRLLVSDSLGPCVECRSTSECANGEYCDQSATCGTANPGPGRCLAMPNSCTLAGDKVCGCDGKTYDNSCLAARAGTGIAYAAECGAPAPCWNGELVSSPTGTCVCVDGVPSDCLSSGN